MNAAPRYGGLFGSDPGKPESFWISLRYFNLYRIAVAALFLGASWVYSDTFNLGTHRIDLFRGVCGAYLASGLRSTWCCGAGATGSICSFRCTPSLTSSRSRC